MIPLDSIETLTQRRRQRNSVVPRSRASDWYDVSKVRQRQEDMLSCGHGYEIVLIPCTIATPNVRLSLLAGLLLLPFLVLSSGGLLLSAPPGAKVDREAMDFFETKVRPLLVENCYSCHGAQQQLSSLRVDSREALLKGGLRGSALVPGDPEQSLIIQAVRHQELKMPLGRMLADAEIDHLESWVRMGAPWPSGPDVTKEPDFYARLTREHWAFQPVSEPDPPQVNHESWSRTPVDRFLLAALRKEGLEPAERAEIRTLARRLSFSVVGLPPDPASVDELLRDPSEQAYANFVDRLLDSPHFGEHWARHWMDVVRFAETYGYEWNYIVKGAWRYRDYLIRAFNQDVPYDHLIREHIAGDLMESPRVNVLLGINESATGSAFLLMGEMGHDDCIEFREIRTDVVDDQIDTLTRAFQGLSVACARCHDHKLDPIPIEDYYALYGILNSARPVTGTLDTGGSQSPLMQRLRALKPQIRSELASAWLEQVEEIPSYLLAAQAPVDPKAVDAGPNLQPQRLERWIQALQRESVDPESFLYPWSTVTCEVGLAPERFQELWEQAAPEHLKEIRDRQAYNQENFTSLPLSDWYPEGVGLLEGRSEDGEFMLAQEGPVAVNGVYPAGIYTHALSERLNGALRSPYLTKERKFLSLQVMGGMLGGRRAVVDNCMLGEGIEVFDSSDLNWQKVSTLQDKERFPVYVELVTKTNNPRLPDRPKRIKGFTEEKMEAPGSYFGIARAMLHDVDDPPHNDLTHLLPLFRDPAPQNPQEAARRYAERSRQSLQAWSQGMPTEDDVRWVHWLVTNHLVDNSTDLTPKLSRLISEYRAIESSLSRPQTINSLLDMGLGRDYSLLQNGDAKKPGDPVRRRYLTVLTGGRPLETNGSGRRELAELIASPRNPLTARVMVNRVWSYLFGRGLVGTTNDFGNFGERPSNGLLLDHLARRFIADGWSLKRLVRRLVLTQAFQQASRTSEAASRIDPENRLLHHYPVRRLEAEAIRDSILATSGRLDPLRYGPSVEPYRLKTKEYRKLHAGPLDGHGRRSVYLRVTRMEGARFLELFDFPVPSVSRGRRDVTNVPSQALAMLNDPFVIQQANYWADRLLEQEEETLRERLGRMFVRALSRSPSPGEVARFGELTRKLGRLYQVPPEHILTSKKIWKDVAHSLFNTKEFIYLR